MRSVAVIVELSTTENLLFVNRISPSAKRAMPVLSKLSPESDKENEKTHEHSVTSAVRDAAMLLMATPLLIDGLMPKKGLDRTGSWVRDN